MAQMTSPLLDIFRPDFIYLELNKIPVLAISTVVVCAHRGIAMTNDANEVQGFGLLAV